MTSKNSLTGLDLKRQIYSWALLHSKRKLKKIEPKLTTEVLKVFNVKYSVNSKKSYGGTSFDNIKKMITKYKKKND